MELITHAGEKLMKVFLFSCSHKLARSIMVCMELTSSNGNAVLRIAVLLLLLLLPYCYNYYSPS